VRAIAASAAIAGTNLVRAGALIVFSLFSFGLSRGTTNAPAWADGKSGTSNRICFPESAAGSIVENQYVAVP
jgi:hypothetical protein